MVEGTAFGYGDFSFSWGDHICAIFDDHVQQMGIMGPFIVTGLRAAQRCVWVAPRHSCAALRKALVWLGADLPTLEAAGQLVIISDVDFYLHQGIFQPSRTMELGRTLLEEGRQSGYATMRIATDVSWLRDSRVDPELWESFETQVTQGIAGLPVVVVCQYDRRQLSGAIIVAAFRTHPIVILGDTIRQNPFYASGVQGPSPPGEVV